MIGMGAEKVIRALKGGLGGRGGLEERRKQVPLGRTDRPTDTPSYGVLEVTSLTSIHSLSSFNK